MSISERASTVRDAHERAAAALPQVRLLIGDERRDHSSGGVLPYVDPTTGITATEFVVAGVAEVDDAVAAARAALPAWRRVSPDRRRALLQAVAAKLREHHPEFATIAALENGQPVRFGGNQAVRSGEHFDYYAGWADKLNGEVVPIYPGRALDYTTPEPYGVVAALITWNGPITAIGRKVAPALAAGNTVVLKSPELAPFAAHRFGELAREAGIPPGVVNVVPGGPEASDHLVRHAGVNKISMTGSTGTARLIMRAAAEHITPMAFELGGKSAALIFPDGDLDKAADFAGTFGTARNAGQGCLLPTRMLVHDAIYDDFVERLVAVLRTVAIGDPLDEATVMGPVIGAAASTRILGVVADATSRGDGQLVVGGTRLDGELADGFFIAPTVFGDVDNRSPLAQEEIFGPVMSLIRFHDEDEGVAMANDSRYGLAGYVFTRDLERAHRVAADLDTGFISVNGANPMPPTAPFGGNHESGFGRESGYAGLQEFIRVKNTYVALQ